MKTLLHATPLALTSAMSITMEPTYKITQSIDQKMFAGMLLFQPVEPVGNGITCQNVTFPGGYESQINCGGELDIDLSADNSIRFTFQAPKGYEIYIDGEERSRIEFQATVPCESAADNEPIDTSQPIPLPDPVHYAEVEGSQIQPTVIGSSTGFMSNYNADRSFVMLGRCAGCAECEIYTRIQVDPPIQKARFESISWTVSYDSSVVIQGPQNYSWGTELYCWIRGATIPEENRHRRTDPEPFAGNTMGLVPAGTSGAFALAASASWFGALMALF